MIKGSIVELVSPAESNGTIKMESLEALVDWHVVEGSAALLVGDTLDAALELDAEERLELWRRVVWQADGRIAVIAGLSANRLEISLEFAQVADEAGVDAVLLTLPISAFPSRDKLLHDVETVARAVKQPLLLRSNERIAPTVVDALARIDGVSGFVDGATDLARARALLALHLPVGFALYAGSDIAAAPFVLEGFAGGVSTTANLVPRMVRKLHDAALSGDRTEVESLQKPLQTLLQAQPEHNLPRALQWALIEMGRVAESTPPLALSQTRDYTNLRRALRSTGCAI
ncbi:dihydrodipicolinate synthase family protein [Solimonas sp. SE-A11]|uniref:dihydrodipicolinate synthase family protein n=1 Tax=Solimonas sp. SE-A11 TaxID=3054954 RepID=UPI00259C984B|nr:dihydrodipicolinate synthase family protein [Solimonas sp. SE-A11]MDM4769027.1 dihydrodipicolinate synthase family protein [Solimonas sp. SE-A11]